jgi:hypothetical protein
LENLLHSKVSVGFYNLKNTPIRIHFLLKGHAQKERNFENRSPKKSPLDWQNWPMIRQVGELQSSEENVPDKEMSEYPLHVD